MAELQDEFVENRKKGLKRRARIGRDVELQNYCFTDGCPGCDAAAKSAKAVGHSEACRKRIEAKMAGDDVAAAKLLRAQNRRGEFHGAVLTAKQAARKAAAAKRAAGAAGDQLTRGDKRPCPRKGCDRRVRRQRQTK